MGWQSSQEGSTVCCCCCNSATCYGRSGHGNAGAQEGDVTNSGKKRAKVVFTAIARKDPLHLTFIQDGGHRFSQGAYGEMEEFIKE